MIIASVSGGLSSALMLKRLLDQHGKENVIAVFADVKGDPRSHRAFTPFPIIDELLHERFGGESLDTYRFLWQLSYALDVPIIRLEQHETVFAHQAREKAFMIRNPNGINFAPCSLYGKRYLIADWIAAQEFPEPPTIALGFDWEELARLKHAKWWWDQVTGSDVIAPLAEKPYLDNQQIAIWCSSVGISLPSAYLLNLPHNNCSGGCVEAGIGQFVLLWHQRPGVFYYWMWMERILQDYIGTESTILRDQRGGKVRPLSLVKLDAMLKAGTVPKRWLSMHKKCACMVGPVIAPQRKARKTITKKEYATP